MKAKALFILLSFFLGVSLVGTLHAQKAEQPTSTAGKAAIVNGVVIQEEEVNRGLLYQQQRMLATTGQVLRPEMMAEARKMVLEELIDRELLYQQSRKKGIAIEDAEVNEQFDQLKKQYPNEQAFKESMAEDHLSEDFVKSRIKMKLAIQRFVDKEFGGKIDVSEGEAKGFYDGNPQYFTQPETIRMSEIVIKVDPKADGRISKKPGRNLKISRKGCKKERTLPSWPKIFPRARVRPRAEIWASSPEAGCRSPSMTRLFP